MAEILEDRHICELTVEARDDVRVSTLRAVLQAMGGELEIRARFPDAEYRIELGEEPAVTRVDTTEVSPRRGEIVTRAGG